MKKAIVKKAIEEWAGHFLFFFGLVGWAAIIALVYTWIETPRVAVSLVSFFFGVVVLAYLFIQIAQILGIALLGIIRVGKKTFRKQVAK